MYKLPKLRFEQQDVINMDFKRSIDVETLLKLALKGAGNEKVDDTAQKCLENFDENIISLALCEAAGDALTLYRAKKKRREQAEYAWRIGWYIACALGTQRDYPERPFYE